MNYHNLLINYLNCNEKANAEEAKGGVAGLDVL